MRKTGEKIFELLKAKTKCIWINSYEEEEVIKDIVYMSTELKTKMNIFDFSFSSGIRTINIDKKGEYKEKSINVFLNDIYNITRGNIEKVNGEFESTSEWNDFFEDDSIVYGSNNIFIIKDFHHLISNPQIMRSFRDIVESDYKSYNVIIVISPITDIPMECKKIFTIIDYDYPNDNNIKEFIDIFIEYYKGYISQEDFNNLNIDEIIKACKGLTINEMNHILKLSIVRHKTILISEINNYKIELIKQSNILEYKIPKININDIGGNHTFKMWLEEIFKSTSEDALKFGCKKPKGYLALGIPGSAKTMFAEAIAKTMKIPFLKLDMSKVMDSKVGNTEKNISQAIKLVKSVSPCVFLIDEVEKTLSGLGSSNFTDGGTMSRLFGSILDFLNENNDTFVIMTSNDISQLPPELTRSGRLDSIWYFGFPDIEERKEIFKIHFKKVNKNVSENILQYAASITNNFTGAEIEECVKNIIRKAYFRYTNDNNENITQQDVLNGCSEVIPIIKSSKEKIAALYDYAKNRARFSNKILCKDNNKNNNIISLKDLK